MVTHANSSSIESVFLLIRNMRQDTPQGVVTAISSQNSETSFKLTSPFAKPSYESSNAPDVKSPSKSLAGRRDNKRAALLSKYLQLQRSQTILLNNTRDRLLKLFKQIDDSKLSKSYIELRARIENAMGERVLKKMFINFLLEDPDFIETMKAGLFTLNEGWFGLLCQLDAGTTTSFDDACLIMLAILFQNLQDASANKRKESVESSYQYCVYKIMTERAGNDCS